jgi:hypothetical protein
MKVIPISTSAVTATFVKTISAPVSPQQTLLFRRDRSTTVVLSHPGYPRLLVQNT